MYNDCHAWSQKHGRMLFDLPPKAMTLMVLLVSIWGICFVNHDQFWPNICSLGGLELKTLDRGRPFEVLDVDSEGVLLSLW